MWFKNAQDANMRILRWRLKLAEYEYEVVYKSGRTNVNADALSRNPVDLSSEVCKIINPKIKLNPTDPKDVEIIRQLLEKEDTEESEDEDIPHTYVHDDHPLSEIPPSEITSFNPEELADSSTGETIEALAHVPETTDPEDKKQVDKIETQRPMLTRSRAKQKMQTITPDKDINLKRHNIPPRPLPMDTNEESEDELPTIITRKPRIIDIQTRANNLVESRDLHFLLKDNLLYFTDILGNPLDSGARKLFERQEIPKLTGLSLGIAKLIKRYQRYHIILPISEDQQEGPTRILNNIYQGITNLRKIAENLKLSSISVAKSEHILNVPWNDIKTKFQTGFFGSDVRIIFCNGLIKYPPRDIRFAILQEMHSTPVGGHRGVTKTYNRIRQNYYWEHLKEDVRQYIRQCLQCQLKKLVRVKTKQPMIITDTPGWTFDKIAMDIVGPLPRTKSCTHRSRTKFH
ncbi:uncharacterized protein LOC116853662 [Odontomachus brunneus]|uniref:uncharacterized protein LOC116853662 n=1 Tax=Odontomachus brunneus TaxID=486640 RepID=UPI0013F262C8|nr:uncharacterized protein LOC116853662 [Odontomachus brunneus]